jgi:hypothetical protein
VRRVVVQRPQVALESPGDHVEIDLAIVEIAKRAHHFGHRVGVHVGRLHRDQGTEPLGSLDNELGGEPRIDQTVVGVDEDALASGGLAPAGHLGHAITVRRPGIRCRGCSCRNRWRTSRENLNWQSHRRPSALAVRVPGIPSRPTKPSFPCHPRWHEVRPLSVRYLTEPPPWPRGREVFIAAHRLASEGRPRWSPQSADRPPLARRRVRPRAAGGPRPGSAPAVRGFGKTEWCHTGSSVPRPTGWQLESCPPFWWHCQRIAWKAGSGV